jgi:hypothetical protein
MHMGMPGMGGAEHHGAGHHRHHRKPPMVVMGFLMLHWLFYAAATVCFLGAINRAATALKTESRIKALKTMPDVFTDEEQMVLIDKITTRSLGGY